MLAILRCLIFLTALGVGSFVGLRDSGATNTTSLPNQVEVETIDHNTPSDANEESEVFVNGGEKGLEELKFVCKNETIRPIWFDVLRAMGGDLLRGPLQEEYDCSKFLHVSEIDLNNDGKSEYAASVQDIRVCSSTANCPLAIYGVFDDEKSRMQTSAGVYDFGLRKLLFSEGIIGYKLLETKSNEFHDLLLRHNGGNYNDNLFLYKFDGQKYQLKRCYEEEKATEQRTRISCSGWRTA
jgi:hypothetical protein